MLVQVEEAQTSHEVAHICACVHLKASVVPDLRCVILSSRAVMARVVLCNTAVVMAHVSRLVQSGVRPLDIGIITPYNAQ
eukprot:scaffold240145_cov19-Tisochrysis_lutea.AAC.1